MILSLPEYKVSGRLALHLEHRIPNHALPLELTNWPPDVIARVVKAYALVGLQDPLKQKLVEPRAIVFGGKHHEGVDDLTNVNWDMVGDYFEWESQAIGGTIEESRRLQDKAKEKWGGIWSHYPVYEDYISRS